MELKSLLIWIERLRTSVLLFMITSFVIKSPAADIVPWWKDTFWRTVGRTSHVTARGKGKLITYEIRNQFSW